MIVRFRWRRAGAHVRVRVFVVHLPGTTGELSGILMFDEDEWQTFRERLRWTGVGGVFFVEDD